MITKSIDALTARTQFGNVMESTEKNRTRFLVSKRGIPKVVILSINDYVNNFVKKSPLLTEIQLRAEKAGLNTMTDEDIQKEIVTARKTENLKIKASS
jgi:prevent-host-death family protein